MDASDFEQLKKYLSENLAIWAEIKPGFLRIWIELENGVVSEEQIARKDLREWLDEP
jgi:hypothetical protein